MTKLTNKFIFLGGIICVAVLVFSVMPTNVSATYTYGNSGAGTLQPDFFSGLTIGPIQQYVSGATNTLNAWIKNNDNYVKTLVILKNIDRCKEAAGYPYRTGLLGQCQYYWNPSTPDNHITTETLNLPANGSVLVSQSVTQYNNQVCGSFQIDFGLISVNGVAPVVKYSYGGAWGASFANMVHDCPTPVDDATCTLSMPSSLTSGQVFNATFSIKNTGSTTWTNVGANAYKLMSNEPIDNTTWGINRIGFPWSTVVPGQSINIGHQFTAPQTAGSNVFNFQMGQEGVHRFGQECRNIVAVQNVACSTNAQCGTNGSAGDQFCQNGNVYQNYKTYACNNPGTPQSYCSNSTAAQLKTTCGANQTCSNGSCVDLNIACHNNSDCGTSGLTGSAFCQGNNVYQNYKTYTCNSPGTPQSYCSNSTAAQLKTTCGANQTCSGGSCTDLNIACTSNSDCGTNGITGSAFCQGNNVYQNYRTYTCNNPGTANSYCSNSTHQQLQQNCSSNQTCSDGSCSNINIACNNNSDCGSSGTIGAVFCQGNNVYQNSKTYTCNNPGTANSYCSSSTNQQLYQTCLYNQTCSNGYCNTNNTCTQNYAQRCVGNAVYWFDSCGNQQNLSQQCQYNQTCQNNACITQQTNLNITKQVRNLSSGNLTWSNSVYASPSDIVQFQVTIQSPSYGTYANNVTVRDSSPVNLTYSDGLTLDGVANSGNVVSGFNIGSVIAGQTRIITYQEQVAGTANFGAGTTTLTNSVSATSDQGATGNATASVLVVKTVIVGPTWISTGLTNNFWADSFFLPLIILLSLAWAWKSGILGLPNGWAKDLRINLSKKRPRALF